MDATSQARIISARPLRKKDPGYEVGIDVLWNDPVTQLNGFQIISRIYIKAFVCVILLKAEAI
jgi:hypothetical protein